MTIEEFGKKYDWETNDYDWSYWSQCVDFARLWAKEWLGSPIGTFGGSAHNWFLNINNTFDTNKRIQVKNNPKDASQFPPVGAIIFWAKTPKLPNGKDWKLPHGHVWVVYKNYPAENRITVIDQNTWSWNWDWSGNNKIRIHDYTFSGVSGRWIYKAPVIITTPTPVVSPPTLANEAESARIIGIRNWERPKDLITREECSIMCYRASQK